MVKNEVDVVLESICNALRFCDTVYVFDNGSTDGSYEAVKALSELNPKVVIAAHSDEVFKNQLRNRVYNQYHHLYSDDDWWYILDADEMLVEDPKPMLIKAANKGKNCMRVWQAQFYFTDVDQYNYKNEAVEDPVSVRRRHYKINWREPRFFQNKQDESWSEHISGRIPPFCSKFYLHSPICRHYAERNLSQIKQRIAIRINNPFSFFHVRKAKENGVAMVKKAEGLNYYNLDGKFTFSFMDKFLYFANEFKYWVSWRIKNVMTMLGHINVIRLKG